MPRRAGLALMMMRRRPMSGVLIVLPQIARLEPLGTTEIPVESEMPGAAVFMAMTEGGAGHHGQIWKYTPSRVEGTPG